MKDFFFRTCIHNGRWMNPKKDKWKIERNTHYPLPYNGSIDTYQFKVVVATDTVCLNTPL